jgi:DNA-binding response OmpR family regulator
MADILVIEDNEALALVMKRALTQRGHKVLSAADGAAGLELFRRSRPALVITDIVMPEKEGITTIHEMKEIEPRTRIIAISGAVDTIDLAARLGADRTLMKPFSTKDLLADVDRLLDGSPGQAMTKPAKKTTAHRPRAAKPKSATRKKTAVKKGKPSGRTTR